MGTEKNTHMVESGSSIRTLKHGKLPDTPIETINRYLDELKNKQLEWAQEVSIPVKIKMLENVLLNIEKYQHEWVQADTTARRIPKGHPEEISSYLANISLAAVSTHRAIMSLRRWLPDGPGPTLDARQDGDRVVIHAFPLDSKDKLAFRGWRAEIHLEQGTNLGDLPNYQGGIFKDQSYLGGVSLILVAGNIAALAVSDLYNKLINEKRVVIIKTNPVLEYMGHVLTQVFEPFVTAGYLRIVIGGSLEGAHLIEHPLIDDIHLTGSDKTFDAIVYGTGEDGAKNKKADNRKIAKPVTGELGNVTPVIVVPGAWTESDSDYQAENIISCLSIYNGYTCCAARVLILPKNWEGAKTLLSKIEAKLSALPAPVNYYPGTNHTVHEACQAYPNITKLGELTETTQPWMLAKDLDEHADEIAFKREFWAAFLGQTYIDANSNSEFLAKAIQFANERLWGTLSAAIIIDRKTQGELESSGVWQKSIRDLKYGTVAINAYPGNSMAIGTTPWGGYPGSKYNDIQSGNGFVCNPFMLDHIEKSVIYAPFKISPQPFWFPTNYPNLKVAKALAQYSITRKLSDFARVVLAGFRKGTLYNAQPRLNKS